MSTKLQVAAIAAAAVAGAAIYALLFKSKREEVPVSIEKQVPVPAEVSESDAEPVVADHESIESEHAESDVASPAVEVIRDVALVSDDSCNLVDEIEEWIAYDPNPESRARTYLP